MEIVKLILPLLGVLVGALISGIANVLKARAERKKNIAIALSDLLEVRHHMVGVDVVLAETRRLFNFSAELSMHLQDVIEKLAPIDVKVHERYDAAVTLLAGIDPLLAFKLRSKNSLPQVLDSLKGIAESNGISLSAISQISDFVRTSLLPKLNEAVVELAGEHSWLTKRKVKRYIRLSTEAPPEIAALFEAFASLPEIKRSHASDNVS